MNLIEHLRGKAERLRRLAERATNPGDRQYLLAAAEAARHCADSTEEPASEAAEPSVAASPSGGAGKTA